MKMVNIFPLFDRGLAGRSKDRPRAPSNLCPQVALLGFMPIYFLNNLIIMSNNNIENQKANTITNKNDRS